jgi:hypothetical protein
MNNFLLKIKEKYEFPKRNISKISEKNIAKKIMCNGNGIYTYENYIGFTYCFFIETLIY